MVFKWVFSVLAERYKQNRVAERKNRTLIEAARTMLADSLLPTTFWAEAVNTACYVQNRVLVPCSQQAPYELLLVEENLHINFLENKPNVAGCSPEWIFDIDSLKNSMNYEPVTAGNQTNSDAGIETNVNAGQAGQEKASYQEYILLPLMLSNSPLSSSNQSTDDKDADEVPDKGDDDVSQRNCQEKKVEASNKEDDHHVQDFRVELDNFLV
ncbi:ribonuclease H-like domain-containing protein [Tanacetum coccineum]|uniref:Ribonuclease H-like domain-containing protein n=1 Tax=Tanacetum coccineum TaxID=301880 RepID=A0ABQ5EQB7_9ASTR